MREKFVGGSQVAREQLPVEQQLALAIRIFTRLRWIPVVLISLGAYPLQYLFDLNVSFFTLLLISLWVACYNLYLIRRQQQIMPRAVPEMLRCVNMHIAFDFITLTLLVHYTGGVLSPLIWFYTIHIIIAAIFFSRRRVIAFTSLAWFALAMMLLAEQAGWITHHHILRASLESAYTDDGVLFLVLAGTAVMWGVVIWLVTLILDRVRRVEKADGELRRQYKSTLDELTASEKKRDLYRRTITHELRSPLVAAQTILHACGSQVFGALTEKQQDSIVRVLDRQDQMLEMIEDLLTYEQMPKIENPLSPTNIQSTAEQIIEGFQPQIDKMNLSVEFEISQDLQVMIEPNDLKTMLSNLIGNAVKYNKPGGWLRVAATREQNMVALRISDTGIGIPGSDHDRLFTEFYRAANARRQTPHGTGLGLAIVKKLTDAHKGRLKLESEENAGTKVTLSLPVAL